TLFFKRSTTARIDGCSLASNAARFFSAGESNFTVSSSASITAARRATAGGALGAEGGLPKIPPPLPPADPDPIPPPPPLPRRALAFEALVPDFVIAPPDIGRENE